LPAAQQPPGQEVASHTQALFTQRWPAAQVAVQATHDPPTQLCAVLHGALFPHRQAPEVHESARCGSQATQASPPDPQAVSEGVRHAPFEQQPEGHEVALQVPHVPPVQV
jgi:hypothetical protein